MVTVKYLKLLESLLCNTINRSLEPKLISMTVAIIKYSDKLAEIKVTSHLSYQDLTRINKWIKSMMKSSNMTRAIF